MIKKNKKIIKIYFDKIVLQNGNINIPYKINVEEYNYIVRYLIYLTIYKKYGGDK